MKNEKQQLDELRRTSVPADKFKNELWRELSVEYDRLYPRAPRFAWTRFAAVPVAVFALFVATGVGMFAYASPNVYDGHPLYSVKRGVERVEEVLPRSPKGRARFHARILDRRISEGEIMIRKSVMTKAWLEHTADTFDMTVGELKEARKNGGLDEESLERLRLQRVRYRMIINHWKPKNEEGVESKKELLRSRLPELRIRIDGENSDFE